MKIVEHKEQGLKYIKVMEAGRSAASECYRKTLHLPSRFTSDH